jgi:hypothetical protein
MGNKPEELFNLQGKEITPLIRKLNTFTKRVREDIEKNLISEADGQELIVKSTSLTQHFLSSKEGIAMKHIRVMYKNNKYDIVPDFMLHQLISSLKIKQFYRYSEQKWVTVGSDRIRGIGGSYSGPERRVADSFSEKQMHA